MALTRRQHDANGNVVLNGDLAANNGTSAPRSAPAVQQFQSPLRQHKRTPSQHREVKETLNARSEYMSDDTEGTKHIINQYIIKEEIGRGSYGAVHLATDQFGNEYAVKEFSKTRLRKRAQSNILKRPQGAKPGRFPPGRGMRASWSQHMRALSNHDAAEAKDSLFLIREEIAIMKKLNHPNLVSLIEVLDDPEEDSLYMVLEMCKKGVIMKVGLDDQADPYPEESCRHWFRDLILGIEYLHAQGVVHRDIKPDNLLLTQDDVLKIVDFGVSEMFEKPEDMKTAKSAGSPAFLPPELCRSKHGDISGKAADIWSMGVSLYCLKYGRLPFRRINVLEMYEAIRTEGLELPPDENRDFVDLISRLLDKNAETRIGMREIRASTLTSLNHSWVTKGGSDPLLSEEENCENMVEPPNELEVNHAFTRKMSHMLVVMVAIHKFKALINKSRVGTPEARTPRKSKTLDVPIHALEAPEPAVRPINTEELPSRPPPPHKATAEEAAELIEARKAYHAATTDARNPPALDTSGKGQAHDPTSAEPRFLGIGTGVSDEFATSESPADVVSDSPTGIDFDVYDRAFSDEVERIRSSSEKQGRRRTTYLTKFVSEKEKYFGDECMVMEAGRSIPSLVANTRGKASSAAAKTWSHIALGYGKEGSTATTSDATGEQEPSRPGLWKGKAETKRNETQEFIRETGHRFADLVSATMHGTKAKSGGGESS
ncbi:kinase-like domain-containing protein [Pseudomassariella vexata]|uniref:Kinase-like domain-containing protein n=1 Tax=Pseudomassariella vexata TaxID=1141098 RepID=A0A1Y2EED6_9PEZI|nr:kinase-like domain-containing protein [Pseudomassariella vexata]ORY69938.1 kinase-like domain-containing protein [Pseudomassariella vexata]